MRISTFRWALILAVLLALAALAADVSGKWKASFTTPDGQTRENVFTFKVDGDKLTGTVAGARGEAPIADGKVKGDEVSFSVTRSFGDQQMKMLYKGKVSGDEIKFTVEVEGGDRTFEMTAKRLSP
jgi:hypothetical protein